MAAKQPSQKDLSVLNVGTPRTNIIAEFGAPQWSDTKDGKKTDVFKSVQGYSTVAKASCALFHGVADVFIFGLWEVVGTPTEAIFNGKDSRVEITYDTSDKVENVVSLVKNGTNVSFPGGVGNGDVQYTKVGQATTNSFFALIAVGDSSIETAVANGGITKIKFVDYKVNNILGFIGEYTTYVYGD